LAQLQVPQWLDAQNELLSQPLHDNPQRVKTLRARLALLGMPAELIAQVERTREPQTLLEVRAPQAGIVTELMVKTGMALPQGATLARINGIDSLWLEAALPRQQAMHIALGANAEFYSGTQQTSPLHGEVEYLLPMLNAQTQIQRARIVLQNPQAQLLVGTHGRVVIRVNTPRQAVFIPTEAVLQTGKRTLVMLALGAGKYRPVAVSTGIEMGDKTEITQGLEAGQQVVASGQFLLDSEASLLGLMPQAGVMSHD
jgi:Cu(I)/Ag(I) efflux system membrane fusion protein